MLLRITSFIHGQHQPGKIVKDLGTRTNRPKQAKCMQASKLTRKQNLEAIVRDMTSFAVVQRVRDILLKTRFQEGRLGE